MDSFSESNSEPGIDTTGGGGWQGRVGISVLCLQIFGLLGALLWDVF